MFGRQMNHFGDWRVQESEDNIVALRFRAEEIQKLINLFQPAALRAIQQNHPVQQESQNHQHRIDDTLLQPGTTIYLKVEGLLNKLEPRFRGPYSIHSTDKKGNYLVKNSLGILLKTVFPRHKIKVVATENNASVEAHYEVEKILKHRLTSNRKFKYLVKWKDHHSSENSWVQESNFDTIEVINKYWESIESRNQINATLRVTPTNLLLISLFFMLFCCCSVSAQIRLTEKLPLCDMTKTPTLIDLQKSCYHSRTVNTREPYFKPDRKYKKYNEQNDESEVSGERTVIKNMNIIAPKSNKIHGFGWQCHMIKIFTRYYKTFIRDEVIENELNEAVNLTPADCELMLKNKRCHNFDMICSDTTSCTKVFVFQIMSG